MRSERLEEVLEVSVRVGNLAAARRQCEGTLGRAIVAKEVSMTDLLHALGDPSAHEVARILFAEALLTHFKTRLSELPLAPLEAALNEAQDPALSTRLIRILGFSTDPRAARAILAKADDGNRGIRLAALRALSESSHPEASRFGVALLQDPDPAVRTTALQGFGPHTGQPAVADAILQAVEDARFGPGDTGDSDLFLMGAIRALAQGGSERGWDFILGELNRSGNPVRVRQAAAEALATCPVPQAPDSLIAALVDAHDDLRMAAARSLYQLGGLRYYHDLAEAERITEDPFAKQQIAALLEQMRSAAQ